MRPAVHYNDVMTGGESHRSEAHCTRCGTCVDLVLQDDDTFLCRFHDVYVTARTAAEPFGPTDDLDRFFEQLEVAPCP